MAALRRRGRTCVGVAQWRSGGFVMSHHQAGSGFSNGSWQFLTPPSVFPHCASGTSTPSLGWWVGLGERSERLTELVTVAPRHREGVLPRLGDHGLRGERHSHRLVGIVDKEIPIQVDAGIDVVPCDLVHRRLTLG